MSPSEQASRACVSHSKSEPIYLLDRLCALQHCDSNHTANQLFQSSSNLLRHKSNNTLFFVLLVCSLGHIVCVGGGYMVALPWKSCCCSGLAAVEVGISVGSENKQFRGVKTHQAPLSIFFCVSVWCVGCGVYCLCGIRCVGCIAGGV